jgi:hypothetical protein
MTVAVSCILCIVRKNFLCITRRSEVIGVGVDSGQNNSSLQSQARLSNRDFTIPTTCLLHMYASGFVPCSICAIDLNHVVLTLPYRQLTFVHFITGIYNIYSEKTIALCICRLRTINHTLCRYKFTQPAPGNNSSITTCSHLTPFATSCPHTLHRCTLLLSLTVT